MKYLKQYWFLGTWMIIMVVITVHEFVKYGPRSFNPWIDVVIFLVIFPALFFIPRTKSVTVTNITVTGRPEDADYVADILRKGVEPVETPHESDT